jgi:ribosomal protein S18 acetylase RimI-like enzyme
MRNRYHPYAMIRVRSIEGVDRPWVALRLEGAFGGVEVARKGVSIDASVLPGFVATDGGRPVGLLTHDVAHGECEVVAILSTERGLGIGRALMDAARDHAVAAGCLRLWLITTNDNIRAFRFYQRWGMDLCAFYRHGARRSRGSSLRCRNWEPTGSRWSTSWSWSCGVPLREVAQSRRASENTLSAKFGEFTFYEVG